MPKITDEVAALLGQQIHNEGEYSGDNATANMYTAFNDAGVECEVGEFLYAMVRVLKPYHILETGTHQGMSTMYMALACRDNGHGLIDTLEFIEPHWQQARLNFQKAELDRYVNSMYGDVTKWNPPTDRRYQLTLLDTEPQLRFGELTRFYDYICPGSFIFIHDLHRHMGQMPNTEHGFAWPWGPLPHQIKQWVRDDKLRPFHFATPRGLTGFYRVAEEDYVWKRKTMM